MQTSPKVSQAMSVYCTQLSELRKNKVIILEAILRDESLMQCRPNDRELSYFLRNLLSLGSFDDRAKSLR